MLRVAISSSPARSVPSASIAVAAMPEAAPIAASLPSSAARRRSNTCTVGFVKRE